MLEEQKSPAPNVITPGIVRKAFRRSKPSGTESNFVKTEGLPKNLGD
jgi:hypothetical protein